MNRKSDSGTIYLFLQRLLMLLEVLVLLCCISHTNRRLPEAWLFSLEKKSHASWFQDLLHNQSGSKTLDWNISQAINRHLSCLTLELFFRKFHGRIRQGKGIHLLMLVKRILSLSQSPPSPNTWSLRFSKMIFLKLQLLSLKRNESIQSCISTLESHLTFMLLQFYSSWASSSFEYFGY
jgi:hypothetical protein